MAPMQLRRKERSNWLNSLPVARQQQFKMDWLSVGQLPTLATLLKEYPEARSIQGLMKAAYEYAEPTLPKRTKLHAEAKLKAPKKPLNKKEGAQGMVKNGDIAIEHILQNLPLEEREWDNPEVFEVNAEAYAKPGQRIGFVSRIDYFGDGQRKGIVRNDAETFAMEGTHFVIVSAGLIDKKGLQREIMRRLEVAKQYIKEQRVAAKERKQSVKAVTVKELRAVIENDVLQEAASALAAMIPRLKKPGTDEFIRYYITTSPRYDGPHGDEIARRLQALRVDDMRHFKAGSARTPVKYLDKFVWTISPTKSRLPGKYYSQSAEKEIDDKEAQTSKSYPDLWAVAGLGSAMYKCNGIRQVPYITIPVSSRLEESTVGENQAGVCVVEYPAVDDRLVPGTIERLVRFWSFRDLIAKEREFITGIKEGSEKIHKQIVDILKKSEDGLTVGLFADELGITDRTLIENALKFLEEPKASQRKTWPSLHYDSSSQLYDFHLDWLQQKLRYVLPRLSHCQEDNFLFFGCMHAGYTTVDYDFIEQQFPEIMLRRNTQTLVCLGDLIAGMHHDFLCTGEVFSGLNNTEQEVFAAELLATVIFKVFRERFDKAIVDKDFSMATPDDVRALAARCLVLLLIIPGNHDLWQQSDGSTPLAMFLIKLRELLIQAISAFLAEKKVPFMNVTEIVKSKIKDFPDFNAVYEMPSGLRVSMQHPHMGSAATTSLRAQHAIATLNAQISGVANFHAAAVVHKWRPDLGQCVTVQVGTEAIYTRFEKRKMKLNVDFGPVSLRTLSFNGRIFMTETGYYNQPILREAISKSTDIKVLRERLKLIQG
jgi:hypothetical protein